MLPSTVAPRAQLSVRLPSGLRSTPVPVAMKSGDPPSGLDYVSVFFSESEAGMEPSRLRDVRGHLAQVPFEPAMRAMARIAAKAWALRDDQAAQLRLAESVFAGHPVLEHMRAFVASNDKAALLAEQHAFVVMRLLVERARDGVLEDGLSPTEIGHLQAALLGATSIVDPLAYVTPPASFDQLETVLAFFIQNGAYNRKPQPMGELVRARELYARIARDPALTGSSHFCPLDDWMTEDYRFSSDEQLSFGFALGAMTTVWADDESAGDRSYMAPEALDDLLATLNWDTRREAALSLLAADRATYRDAFAAMGNNPVNISWELRPFMQHPFVRLHNGGLILLSPRVLSGWITDGFYYRLLDAAKRRNTTKRQKTSRAFTAFAGELLERWCLELAQAAFASGKPQGGGKVYGEQSYGKKGEAKTTDVAVHIGTDLVLFEITASRLRAETLTSYDTALAVGDLERMVVEKIKQLDSCVNALASGAAHIPANEPEVLWEGITRVWPIVVTGGHLAHNEFTWRWLERKTRGLLTQSKTQPLTLLDIEDYEALMGVVEHGDSLIRLLKWKTQPSYRELELAICFRDDPRVPRDSIPRPAMIEEAFQRETSAAQGYFAPSSATH